MNDPHLSALGVRVRDSLLRRHQDWAAYVDVRPNGDLEVAIPAPRGSRARRLIVATQGEVTWIRYAPPRARYCVASDREMHAVIDALLADDAFFVVITDGDRWLETSLLRPGQEPVLGEGQVADVVSWSGRNDRIVTYTEKKPVRAS